MLHRSIMQDTVASIVLGSGSMRTMEDAEEEAAMEEAAAEEGVFVALELEEVDVEE